MELNADFSERVVVHGDETEWVKAENVVHHSAEYPSHIVLPVSQRP